MKSLNNDTTKSFFDPLGGMRDKLEVVSNVAILTSKLIELQEQLKLKEMNKEAIIEIDGKRHRVTIHEAIEDKINRWRAEEHGEYWGIDVDGNIGVEVETLTIVDDYQHLTRNYFQTKEEAKHELHRIKTVSKIRDRIEELNDGWAPELSERSFWVCINKNHFYVSANMTLSRPKWMYFKSEEIGETLIKEFGDDLKLLFE